MSENYEETCLVGIEISFWVVEWDAWKGQFQIMEVHKSEVGNGDFISCGEWLKVFQQKLGLVGKRWLRDSV